MSAQRSAPAQMEHRFFPPSPLLSAFVASFWIHRSAPSAARARSRVLPTGTAQLIVDLSDDGLSVPDLSASAGRSRDSWAALLHGADTTPFLLETDRPLYQFGVDFQPGGAYPFFAPPASALQDAHVSLDTLWGAQRIAALRERLVAARTLAEQARLLEWLLLRQVVHPLEHHPAVARALRALADPNPGAAGDAALQTAHGAQIARLAAEAGLSSGRLTRVFQEEVGLTPKQFARVRRFRSVLRRTRAEQTQQRVNWAQLAVECGYYDQAHLIKEFHAFAGVCPSAYLRARDARSSTTFPLAV